ncbi:MAG TPA: hypothetical protein DEA96_14170 [Leptospiraceae bacterium]|nr:hypothetical protein [Spirochaetaceae bacterium]HBS06109.1 hypothetical protein [Leptospiraceae bacterium]
MQNGLPLVSFALIENNRLILGLVSIALIVLGLRFALRYAGILMLDYGRNRMLWELLVRNPGTLALFLTVVAGNFLLAYGPVPEQVASAYNQVLFLSGIALAALLGIRMMLGFSRLYLRRFNMQTSDNLAARKVHTQVRIIERIAIVFILFLAIITAALSFEQVREFGVSILASAGVLGIILGFAAQKSIALIFAGIQIAITQPIRIDDAVIVENEWGWIEEITLTYVVIRLWDRRRLIVPINYFTDKPFQNWTRQSADLLGTVYVYLDYRMPVEEIRTVARTIVESTPLWNGEVCVVQVTEFMKDHMQLRILATANSSPETYDLRCFIREKLLEYLLENYPEALPRIRLEKTDT